MHKAVLAVAGAKEKEVELGKFDSPNSREEAK
jgi:hypothetical protein